MEEQLRVSIRVKPGHPTGEYRRGGFVFHVKTEEVLPASDVTAEMIADPWLVISPIDVTVAPAAELPQPEPDVTVAPAKKKRPSRSRAKA